MSAAGLEYAPPLVLATLLAGYAAVLYSLVAGRPLRHLAYLLPMALVGVLLGQAVAVQLPAPGLTLGDLHLPEALVGGCLALFVARRWGL